MLVTHDEYEHKMELVVFAGMAAELNCSVCFKAIFLLFKSCFHIFWDPLYIGRQILLSISKQGSHFLLSWVLKDVGFKVLRYESCSQKKGAGDGGKPVSYCFLLKAFTQPLEMLISWGYAIMLAVSVMCIGFVNAR